MGIIVTWLSANWGTILVCALLVALVAGLVYKLIKDKKQGKSTCSCGCSGCAMKDQCHKQPPKNQD